MWGFYEIIFTLSSRIFVEFMLTCVNYSIKSKDSIKRFGVFYTSHEEGIATHSGILAWRIPWTEEPGGLWSIGSQRVGHN